MTNFNAKNVWKAVLGKLEVQITRPSYETWLKGTIGIAFDNGSLLVRTPNTFVSEMLEQRMYTLISRALEQVTSIKADIYFQVQAEQLDSKAENLSNPLPGPDGASLNALPNSSSGLTLNPKYTFDTFVVGKSNELAHAASLAVTKSPGTLYSPLVIYSDVGLGKTHLLHAMGHKIADTCGPIIHTTAEEFTNAYIKSIRDGKTEEFRDKYRNASALLLDDVQFLIGKEQTQEGFFHTFNALHALNRQIIITTDRPIASISLLENRIRSRLQGGLVVDMQAPDLETRIAILESKINLLGVDVDPLVIKYLGERFRKNIRELEGCLNRLVAYSQMVGSSINLDLLKHEPFNDYGKSVKFSVSAQQILELVASHYLIPAGVLAGGRRDRKTSLARHVTMYFLSEEIQLGPSAIGRLLGGKDHSSVLHGCRRIIKQLNLDERLRQDIIKIQESIYRIAPAS